MVSSFPSAPPPPSPGSCSLGLGTGRKVGEAGGISAWLRTSGAEEASPILAWFSLIPREASRFYIEGGVVFWSNAQLNLDLLSYDSSLRGKGAKSSFSLGYGPQPSLDGGSPHLSQQLSGQPTAADPSHSMLLQVERQERPWTCFVFSKDEGMWVPPVLPSQAFCSPLSLCWHRPPPQAPHKNL